MVEGWETIKLGDALIGKPTYGINAPSCEYRSGALKYIRITDITEQGRYIKDNSAFVDDMSAGSYILKTDDIVVARTGASVGKSYLYNPNDGQLVYAGFLIKLSIDKEKASAKFIFECLHTKNFRDWIASESMRSGQPGINGEQYANLELFVPKEVSEQAEIAKVLSDTDEYIATLKKLIEKKKAIKTGTMQELLTGKRRLKGFTGEWVEKALGELGNCIRGVSYNPYSDLMPYGNSDTVTLLRASNIINGQVEYTDVQFVVSSIVANDKELLTNDIIIAMSSGSRLAIGKSASHAKKSGKFCAGAFCAAYRSSANAYIKFLFQTNSYRKQLENLLEGTSINNLNGKQIEGMAFSFPPTDREQTAIAEVLSDMDAEIEVLSAKLQKAKALKIGMMQQLLTGQIRLVEIATGDSRLEDAVVISGIVDIWGREQKYPLGRVKVAKLFYLYTRKVGGDISRFHEHAAGPYDETVRHGGGEVLATQSGYIEIEDRGDSSKFSCGKNIEEAKKQLYDFDAVGTLKWLDDNFRMTSKEELELLATVDLARLRLEQTGRTADTQSVYDYISQSTDWAAKLDRADFHISNIAKALKQSRELFGQGGQA